MNLVLCFQVKAQLNIMFCLSFIKVSQIKKDGNISIRILPWQSTCQYLNMLVAPWRASFLRTEVKKKYTSKWICFTHWHSEEAGLISLVPPSSNSVLCVL